MIAIFPDVDATAQGASIAVVLGLQDPHGSDQRVGPDFGAIPRLIRIQHQHRVAMGGQARPPPVDVALFFSEAWRDRHAARRCRGIEGIIDRRLRKFRRIRKVGVGPHFIDPVSGQRSVTWRRALGNSRARSGAGDEEYREGR